MKKRNFLVHSAAVVREYTNKLLEKVGMHEPDVFAVITDNGSNFIKAYKEAMYEMAEDFQNNNDEENDEEEENDEDEELEENELEEENPDLDSETTPVPDSDGDDVPTVAEIQQELVDFEKSEADFVGSYSKRISCIAHDLALIMSTVFDKKSILHSNVIALAKRLIIRFKKSHKATNGLAIKTKEAFKKPLVLMLLGGREIFL
uniref:Uncharacterized protein n=1 Tax=Acrobeloides nanus TaxID=290746 RepID=A0A914CHP3_9BILA